MSGLINKVKDAFASNKDPEAAARTGHYDDVKTDPASHANRGTWADELGSKHKSGAEDTSDSSMMNKADHSSSHTSGAWETSNSSMMNKAEQSSYSEPGSQHAGTDVGRLRSNPTTATGGQHDSSMMKGDHLVGSEPNHSHHHHSLKDRHDNDYGDTQTGLGEYGQDLGHDESTGEPTPGNAKLPSGGKSAGYGPPDTGVGYGSTPGEGLGQHNDQPIIGRSNDDSSLEGSMLNRPDPRSGEGDYRRDPTSKFGGS